METKPFWQSKTFWVNTIAGIGMVIQTVTGHEILDISTQAVILSVVNVILRFVTKGGVTW